MWLDKERTAGGAFGVEPPILFYQLSPDIYYV